MNSVLSSNDALTVPKWHQNDDIEPVSRNAYLFVRSPNTDDYGEKENGQTADVCNLSALAPHLGLEPRTP